MNILIVCNHYAVCSARYASDAFTRLGHSVRHVGPAMGRNIWGLTLPEEYVWEPDEELKLGNYHSGWLWADIVIVMDTDPAILDAANGIPNPKSNLKIVWTVDNHVRDVRRNWIDHYFLAHRHVSVMEWEHPEIVPADIRDHAMAISADMTHLPCCYDPVLHTPSPIPYTERQYDVACLGVMYPQRRAAVQALQDAGYKVIWGSGLVYDSYVAAYHNARISLCLSACGDVAQRVFETAAMGNVVVTDNCPDYQILKPNGFYLIEPGESIVDAVRNVLSDADAAQEQIKQSKWWAVSHTWDARAQKIIDWYGGRNG